MKHFWRSKRVIIFAVLVVLIIGGGLIRAHSAKKQAALRDRYHIMTVTKTPDLVETGTVMPIRQETLKLPDGKVTVLVKNNMAVEKGETLVTTNDVAQTNKLKALQNTLSSDQANLALKQRQLTTLKGQLAQLSSTADNYADLNDQFQSLQADINSAQATVNNDQLEVTTASSNNDSQVTAPFSGTVSVKNGASGQPVVKVSSNGHQIQGYVSEYDYHKIKQGESVALTALAGQQKFKGTISNVDQLPDTSSKTNTALYQFSVKCRKQLLDGQHVSVAVAQTYLRIPRSAVLHRNGQTVVMLVKNGRAHQTKVNLKVNGDFAVIKQGLHVGEKFISNPQKVKDGQQVNQ